MELKILSAAEALCKQLPVCLQLRVFPLMDTAKCPGCVMIFAAGHLETVLMGGRGTGGVGGVPVGRVR